MATPHTAILQGGGSLTVAYFVTDGESVHVTALIGAASYIDRAMSKAEARKQWDELVAAGWRRVAKAMPLRTLRLHIYD